MNWPRNSCGISDISYLYVNVAHIVVLFSLVLIKNDKSAKKMKKVLDKPGKRWYNNQAVREGAEIHTTGLENFLKKS